MQTVIPADLRVLQIGHVCIDHNVIDGVRVPETWGSGLMHTRAYLQKLGVVSSLIAPRGSAYAQYAPEEEFLNPSVPGGETLVYENNILDGVRTQYAHNLEASLPPALDTVNFAQTGAVDVIFVSPLTQQYDYSYLSACLERLPKDAYRVLLPQGYTRDISTEGVVRQTGFQDAARIVPMFDLVVLSDEDIADAKDAAREWAAYSDRTSIVVTHNHYGATLFTRAQETFVPTTPVPETEIVEPIGLGDTFTASMAIARFSGMDEVSAIQHAHQAVAAKMRGN